MFDVSQRGDWNNTRNETVNGKPCRLKGTILDELPKVRRNAQGVARSSRGTRHVSSNTTG